ncbi:MAG TPA: type II toxin-antitoxin system VapC family toxin [Candidatus Sulfotelmatobacter sp.]|jgi:predicted nucleic-acid-binding protein
MTGLDTNIIVRYVTQDDPAQTRTATKLIESLSAEEPGFIALVVVAELAWVLQTSYSSTRDEIVSVLESLLRAKTLVVERTDLVRQALRQFSAGRADFADYLVERCANAAGCERTFTFDKVAATDAGMRLLR